MTNFYFQTTWIKTFSTCMKYKWSLYVSQTKVFRSRLMAKVSCGHFHRLLLWRATTQNQWSFLYSNELQQFIKFYIAGINLIFRLDLTLELGSWLLHVCLRANKECLKCMSEMCSSFQANPVRDYNTQWPKVVVSKHRNLQCRTVQYYQRMKFIKLL